MKKKLVFSTGAGMSAESGLSTFRDSDGLWANYDVMEVASTEGWAANPTKVCDFYSFLRREFISKEPNEGHRIICNLEEKYDVEVITQNVDDLHERAGSSKVLHLHGELMKVRTEKPPYKEYVVTPDKLDYPYGTRDSEGNLLRPFIVFFGEDVPNIVPAIELCEQADIFVIIGTSLQVYPAAALIRYTRKNIPIYYIDPNPSTVPEGVVLIQASASDGLRILCEKYL